MYIYIYTYATFTIKKPLKRQDGLMRIISSFQVSQVSSNFVRIRSRPNFDWVNRKVISNIKTLNFTRKRPLLNCPSKIFSHQKTYLSWFLVKYFQTCVPKKQTPSIIKPKKKISLFASPGNQDPNSKPWQAWLADKAVYPFMGDCNMSCYSLEFSQFIFGDLKVGEF